MFHTLNVAEMAKVIKYVVGCLISGWFTATILQGKLCGPLFMGEQVYFLVFPQFFVCNIVDSANFIWKTCMWINVSQMRDVLYM